ncbi:hypothetical protein OPT61_g5596 [Boeremia exigua]|uniref:Uncharacterized protein n=1 Tax=Boeremia exigua TaxID=749465 RepID=A0ACC2I9V3_9PLEO|nr:hypothetical protein OPT61_g5596 [Boeremia exigua]
MHTHWPTQLTLRLTEVLEFLLQQPNLHAGELSKTRTVSSAAQAASMNIISKALDPLFAISIGLAAAATRINREEKEKGRSTQETMDVFKRRWALAWQSEPVTATKQ